MLRDNILAKAKSYVGLRENPPGSNKTMFNQDYYGSDKAAYWCCIFAWDIFRMCKASKYFYGGKKTASCTTLLDYYKKHHSNWVTTDINQARQGDLVFYQFDKDKYADHIGIFDSKYSSSKFYAIEGNTSLGTSGSQSNGEYVARRLRKKSQVMAFVHIEYEDEIGKDNVIIKGLDYSLVFNYIYYSNRYDDLRKAFGTDKDLLFKHFLEYGMKEGRQAIETFDVRAYKARYADLQNAFGENLPLYYKHYMEYGYNEKRIPT